MFTFPLALFATTTNKPFGEIPIEPGDVPTLIDFITVFVAVLITETLLLS